MTPSTTSHTKPARRTLRTRLKKISGVGAVQSALKTRRALNELPAVVATEVSATAFESSLVAELTARNED